MDMFTTFYIMKFYSVIFIIIAYEIVQTSI